MRVIPHQKPQQRRKKCPDFTTCVWKQFQTTGKLELHLVPRPASRDYTHHRVLNLICQGQSRPSFSTRRAGAKKNSCGVSHMTGTNVFKYALKLMHSVPSCEDSSSLFANDSEPIKKLGQIQTVFSRWTRLCCDSQDSNLQMCALWEILLQAKPLMVLPEEATDVVTCVNANMFSCCQRRENPRRGFFLGQLLRFLRSLTLPGYSGPVLCETKHIEKAVSSQLGTQCMSFKTYLNAIVPVLCITLYIELWGYVLFN